MESTRLYVKQIYYLFRDLHISATSSSAFDLLTLGSSEGPQSICHKRTSVYQNKRWEWDSRALKMD